MAQIYTGPPPGKRALPSEEEESLLSDEAPPAKRACLESAPSSAHLTLLEELCDLDSDESESYLRPLTSEDVPSAPQEDLVAEMMKSLEKVIQEGEGRAAVGNASTSHPASPSPLHDASKLGLDWASDLCPEADLNARFDGDTQHQASEDDLQADARFQHLLQASDDELGLPLSSSSSDFDDSTFHEEWASLTDDSGSGSAFNLNWLDSSLIHPFEDSRETYEPVVLF